MRQGEPGNEAGGTWERGRGGPGNEAGGGPGNEAGEDLGTRLDDCLVV